MSSFLKGKQRPKRYLFEEVPGELLLEHPFLRDVIEEILALHVFKHDEVRLTVLEEIDESDDVVVYPPGIEFFLGDVCTGPREQGHGSIRFQGT